MRIPIRIKLIFILILNSIYLWAQPSIDEIEKKALVDFISPHLQVEPLLFDATLKDELYQEARNFCFDRGATVLEINEGFINNLRERGDSNIETTLTVTVSHSPDELELGVDALLRERLSSISARIGPDTDYFRSIIKVNKKDWTAFRNALRSYDGISEDLKIRYFDVVDGVGSFEAKQSQLENLPSYEKIRTEVYPSLRCAKWEILKVKEKKSDALISVLAKGIIDGRFSSDTLQLDELLYSATLMSSQREKDLIYQMAVEIDSESLIANNNYAANKMTMLQYFDDELDINSSEEYGKIIRYLESVLPFNNVYTAYNLALANYNSGNYFRSINLLEESEIEDLEEGKLLYSFSAFKSGNYRLAREISDQIENSELAKLNAGYSALIDGNLESSIFRFDRINKSKLNNQENAALYFGRAMGNLKLGNAEFISDFNTAIKLDVNSYKAIEKIDVGDYGNENISLWRPPKTLKQDKVDIISQYDDLSTLCQRIEKSLFDNDYQTIRYSNIPDNGGVMIFHALEKFDVETGKSTEEGRFSKEFVPWTKLDFWSKITSLFSENSEFYRFFLFVITDDKGSITSKTSITSDIYDQILLSGNLDIVGNTKLSDDHMMVILVYEFIQEEGDSEFKQFESKLSWKDHLLGSNILKSIQNE